MNEFQSIQYSAPSNIALIKYWGKHGNQLPNNPSLSLTLSHAVTHTQMNFRASDSGLIVRYFFDRERNDAFENKVVRYLESLHSELPFLQNLELEFHSSNTFPHSTGIASSASSMAALAQCLVYLEQVFTKSNYSESQQLQRASYLARLGSGSAARSLYRGWVTWGEIEGLANTSNEYASPYLGTIAPIFQSMGDAVLIVDSDKKKVSSTFGHSLMNAHPFAQARYKQAREHLKLLIDALQQGEFLQFANIVETEALTLHSLLMTSSEDGLLLKANSLILIEAIRKARQDLNLNVCFTIDAGPNIHLLYPLSERQQVMHLIERELVPFCESGRWIDDSIRQSFE